MKHFKILIVIVYCPILTLDFIWKQNLNMFKFIVNPYASSLKY